jgi:hypothetical protein
VRRTAGGPAIERITAAEFGLLATLQRGETLGAALDAALAHDVAFDVAAALQRCVARAVFSA